MQLLPRGFFLLLAAVKGKTPRCAKGKKVLHFLSQSLYVKTSKVVQENQATAYIYIFSLFKRSCFKMFRISRKGKKFSCLGIESVSEY